MIFLLLFLSQQSFAETRIAVLDFELKDLTLIPRIAAEIKRTASIKPLLEGELTKAGYTIVSIDSGAQDIANSGFGYLFQHHDVAANLAGQSGADFVLVGRLHKPSFLFAYLMSHLIKVSNGELVGNYVTETKGGEIQLTLKAVETLAGKINNTLKSLSTR